MRVLASWPLATLLIGVAALMGINAATSSEHPPTDERTNVEGTAVERSASVPYAVAVADSGEEAVAKGYVDAPVAPATAATIPTYESSPEAFFSVPTSDAFATPSYATPVVDTPVVDDSDSSPHGAGEVASVQAVPAQALTPPTADYGWSSVESTEWMANAPQNSNTYAAVPAVPAGAYSASEAQYIDAGVFPTPQCLAAQTPAQASAQTPAQWVRKAECPQPNCPVCPAANCPPAVNQEAPLAALGAVAQAFVMGPNGPQVIASYPLLPPTGVPVAQPCPHFQPIHGAETSAETSAHLVQSNAIPCQDAVQCVDLEVHAIAADGDNPFTVFGEKAALIEHIALLHQRIGELRGEASVKDASLELAKENAAMAAKLEAVEEFHALMDGFVRKSMEVTEMKAQQHLQSVHAAYAMQGAATLPEPVDPSEPAQTPNVSAWRQSQVDQLRQENKELRAQLQVIRAQLNSIVAPANGPAAQAWKPSNVY